MANDQVICKHTTSRVADFGRSRRASEWDAVSRGIDRWLDGLGLGRYADAFADNEIDLHALPHITEADLKAIGVALEARRTPLTALAELGDSDEPATADESSDDRSTSAESLRQSGRAFSR